MDAGIADTLNHRTARLVAEHMDKLDVLWFSTMNPWYEAVMSQAFLGENDATDADRAWYFGILSTVILGEAVEPADGDWENLFANFRAEILARRDPQTPPVRAAQTPCGMV